MESNSVQKPCAASVYSVLSKPWRHSGAWLAFVTLLVYLLLPTKEFYWDGVGFALAIEDPQASPESLLHPNHLVYNLVGYVAWRAMSAAGVGLRALFVLQLMNALFAAASVYLVWSILIELTQSGPKSTWGAFLFAFSATWWRFSTDADAYIPSVCLLLVCFRLLLPGNQPKPFAAGLAHGAAMLFHQLALFFFPVAVISILYPARRDERAGERRNETALAAKYAVTSFTVTAVTNLAAFLIARPSGGLLEFWDWITLHSPDSAFSFNPLGSAALTLRGTVRLFFGGKLSQVKPDLLSLAGIAALCVLLVLFGHYWMQMRNAHAKIVPPTTREQSNTWLVANLSSLVWALTYTLFLFFWLPQNTFYRLFYLPALIFLLVTAPVWHAGRIRLLAVFSLTMCVCNLMFYVYPLSRTETNEVLAFALDHQNAWQQGSMILCREYHTDLWTIRYFNPQIVWMILKSPEVSRMEIQRDDSARARQSLWLEGTAYDAVYAAAGGKAWLSRHVDMTRSLLYTSPSHKIRFYRVKTTE